MDRTDVVRTDFPEASPGFERSSVEAHLEAVAAQLAALEARARALEVELDAVRSGKGHEPADSLRQGSSAPEKTGVPSPPQATGDPVAARLVATEMLLDGAERETVIARVESEYGMPDAAALVDEVIARTG
ncbi:MAG: hypothetical protein ACKOGM_05170 [Solirubrobacterales bacterium]